jgi:hypothetical protein
MSTGTWIYEKGNTTGGGDGSGGGVPDAIGPVTGFTSVAEIGTRYVTNPDRLVHLTVGFVPICPVPQAVTYLISPDNGATWIWIGAQRMQTIGQQLRVDRLAPGVTSQWKVAAVAGNQGGDPSPILDANLATLYPGIVRSIAFPVVGLSTPANTTGITATIGSCSNIMSADGYTQYGSIPGVVYTDPTSGTAFFVRITIQILDINLNPLASEQPYGGTQITGGSHTEHALLITYVPGLAFVRYRFYVANRNSQGGGDFADPTTNTLQMVSYNGGALADHYDVRVVVPGFTPPDPVAAFNVTSVTASEVGPKYQDEKQGLHTSIGVVPVIDHDYSSPRTVTLWFDFGTGNPIWQGWYSLTGPGQVIRIGDSTLGTDGVRKSGDIWVPANTAQGSWVVYCGAGHIDNGVNPSAYKSYRFTVVPVAPCLPNGTTQCQFLSDPATSDPIDYAKWDPGIWYWGYYCLTWVPPALANDPNYWFTMITVQKGATIGGVWTPAPDSEGINEDPHLNFLGRVHVQVMQLPGVANDQSATIKKFGPQPSNWVIPAAINDDLSPNVYRDFRFWCYNVSRLGTDTSGSGGAGTYTLQTSCWPGGADHFTLTPQPKQGSLSMLAANPATIALPLKGGNGQPMTVEPGAITGDYLGPQSVQAINMAKDAITAANQALAAGSVVDPNIHDVGINKVTYGTSVFAGDVVLSRGIGLPVIVLQNTGIFLYGQADASTGASGLTSKPYVAVQNNGIGLFQGGTTGGSVFLDAVNAAITIYSHNGDTSFPYLTVNANGLTATNGPNSMTIGTNAMSFIDTQFHNRLDMNSAGFTISNTSSNNKLVITATDLQLQLGNVARVTINNTTGVTLSDGGTSSVVINTTTVQIIASGAQATFSSNQIQMVQGAATVTITAASLKLSNGTSSVEITAASVTITNGSFTSPAINGGSLNIGTSQGTLIISNSTSGVQVSSTNGNDITHIGSSVISIYTGSIGSEMSPNTLIVGRNSAHSVGFNSTDGSVVIGSKTVIDANQIWRQGVQCVDHVIGNDFGVNGVGFGVGTPGAPVTFRSADNKTVTVVGGIVTAVA